MLENVIIPSNSIGVEINKENRIKAKRVLEIAKEKESELISSGAVWMKKEKTMVLVPKKKINDYKQKGFKL
jgi:hypothetical protein